MKHVHIVAIGLLLVAGTAGCASMKSVGDWMAPEKEPTIAHVHIGHAMTHWKHTPKKMGLFIVAEKEATVAFTEASLAVRKPIDPNRVKMHIRHVMYAIDAKRPKHGPGLGFGLKRALGEAVSHISFAGQSKDASDNVKQFVQPFADSVQSTMERCDLILALGQDILGTNNTDDAVALANEVIVLARANLQGMHAGDNPAPITDPNDFGLKQLRAQIDGMIDREDPPYQPAPRRYLLGIVRLPSGDWTYSWRTKNDDDTQSY